MGAVIQPFGSGAAEWENSRSRLMLAGKTSVMPVVVPAIKSEPPSLLCHRGASGHSQS